MGKTSGELIPLTLGVPPLPAVGRSVSPRSGEATFAEFEVTPGQPGLLQGQVQLPADAFGFDDQRLVAQHVLEALRVLIVGAETDSRYLAAALDPFPEGDERSIMRVQRIEPEALAQTNLAGFEVVVLADAPELSSGAVKNLAGHVATGAGALLVAGPRSDPSAYNGSVLAALSLTGVKLGAAVELKEGVAIADFETARPPLAAFGSPLAGDLMAPRFTRAREISLSADASARVLASLENGTPALIEAAHGRGRVIVLNSSPGPAWSDLVRRPVYLPLVHRLVYHLSQGRTPRVAPGGPGETIAGLMPVQTGRAQVRAEDARPAALEQDAGTWSFVPERVGTFVVEVGGEEVAAFAVNLDPAESDPTRLTAADLSRRLAPADVVLVKAEDLPAFLRRPAPTRTELSALLALAALLLLALESVYSLEGRRADTGMGEALSATRPHRVRG